MTLKVVKVRFEMTLKAVEVRFEVGFKGPALKKVLVFIGFGGDIEGRGGPL